MATQNSLNVLRASFNARIVCKNGA